MDDREYEDFLVALSRKHLRMDQLAAHSGGLRVDVGQLMDTSRLLHAVRERVMEDAHFWGSGGNVYETLGAEISQRSPGNADRLMYGLRAVGVMDALDDSVDLVLNNLRMSAVPSEDLDMLRRAGVEDPEAEVTILIHKARTLSFPSEARTLSFPSEESPSEALERAPRRLGEIGEEMQQETLPPEDRQPKRRKILNGVGKLLGGLIVLGGNTLLVKGTIWAPNPATGSAAIASAGVGVTSVLTGLGDLRGE
jgi:hypothetical protein